MKKMLVVLSVLALGLTACDKETPDPVPSVSVSPSPSPSRSIVPTEDPAPAETVTETETVKPPTATSTTDSEPPATQFLKRWGQSYPGVEEATIMRAGADTCDLIKVADADWQTSNDFAAKVQDVMRNFGEVDLTTAASFAVDANQNLCPTLP